MTRRGMQSLLISSICLMGIVAGRAADQEQPEAKDATIQAQASCLVRITFDPQMLPLNPESVGFLFNSSGVGGLDEGEGTPEIAFQPLGMAQSSGRRSYPGRVPRASAADPGNHSAASGDPTPSKSVPRGNDFALAFKNHYLKGDMAPNDLIRQRSSESDGIILGRLIVRAETPARSRELMGAVIKRFEAAIKAVNAVDLDRLDKSSHVAARQAAEALQRLKDLHERRNELLRASQLSDLSRDSLLAMSRRLETERQETAVTLETQKARNEAIRKELARSATRPAASATEGAPGVEYRGRIEELEGNLEELARSYRPEHPKLKQAKEMLDLAKSSLQKKRLTLLSGPIRSLDTLSEQLSELSVDLLESEARLKLLDRKCEEMRDLLAKADDYEIQVGLELPLARAAYENARQRQQFLQMRIEGIEAPTVTVLGD